VPWVGTAAGATAAAPGARHRGALCGWPPRLRFPGPPEKPFHARSPAARRPGERPGAQSLFHGTGKGEGEPRSWPPRGCRPRLAGSCPHPAWHPLLNAPQSATGRVAGGLSPSPVAGRPPTHGSAPGGAPHPIAPAPPVLTQRPSCASACSRWGGAGRCRSRRESPWGLSWARGPPPTRRWWLPAAPWVSGRLSGRRRGISCGGFAFRPRHRGVPGLPRRGTGCPRSQTGWPARRAGRSRSAGTRRPQRPPQHRVGGLRHLPCSLAGGTGTSNPQLLPREQETWKGTPQCHLQRTPVPSPPSPTCPPGRSRSHAIPRRSHAHPSWTPPTAQALPAGPARPGALLGAHLPSHGDPSRLRRPPRLRSAAVTGEGEPGPAASPRCGQLGCSPGQGTEQTLCAPICHPRKENIPGIHPGERREQRGAATGAGLGLVPPVPPLPPPRGARWDPALGARRAGTATLGTATGTDTARGGAGAAVRTRNYGFRLRRGKRGCRRATLPAWRAKHGTTARAAPSPARRVPGAGSAGRGTDRQGGQPRDPQVLPRCRLPPKPTQLLPLGSSALAADPGTEKAAGKRIIFCRAAAL